MYQVSYARDAQRDLRDLEFRCAQRIVRKIYFYSQQKNPLSFAKSLRHCPLGSYRFRIGDYRAIFDVAKDGTIHVLMILRIKHRKDIYGL